MGNDDQQGLVHQIPMPYEMHGLRSQQTSLCRQHCVDRSALPAHDVMLFIIVEHELL